MSDGEHTVDLDPSTFAIAKNMAEREHVSIKTLLGSLVRHRAEYVDGFESVADGQRFSVSEWEMDRAPGETDEDYEARLSLFQ